MKKTAWAEAWRGALRADYTPVVDVRTVKPKEQKTVDADASSLPRAGVIETLKYSVKPSDMTDAPRWFVTVTEQTHKLRFIATGGLFKDVLKPEEKITDEEMIHVGDDAPLDILPRLKSGDSQRRQSCDCIPERVPASTRLPRGTRLGFRRKHSHVGNFTGTNQPPIPPGLTISPQADTACPAAVSPVSTQKAERQKFQSRCALYPRPEGRGFTARWVKNLCA